MKIIGDTQIVRVEGFGNEYREWEIPVAFNVEELYHGTNDTDDPSACYINERVKVLEDVGPFRIGDLLVLTAQEQRDIEEDELNNQL